MRTLYVHPLIMLAAAGALLFATGCGKQEQPQDKGVAHEIAADKGVAQENAAAVDSTAAEPSGTPGKNLPKLLDLGAHSCIPCKMMAPILEELTEEYKGRMEVEFIDVWQNKAAGQEYGIRTIPTQIFFGSDGEELFRHEGFMSKEDILAKWAELGYTFPETDEEQ